MDMERGKEIWAVVLWVMKLVESNIEYTSS